MINNNNKNVKKYLKAIKILLPLYTKNEKQFLKDFNNSVLDYIDSNPNSNHTDVEQHFGPPFEVVHEYISSLDSDKLYKLLNIRIWVKRLILLMMLLLLAVSIMFSTLIYRDYQYSLSQTVTHEDSLII